MYHEYDASREYDRNKILTAMLSDLRSAGCYRKAQVVMKTIPKFRAEVTGVMLVSEFRTSVGLLSLDSCCGVPITKNSVLLGLRDSKLDDIQDDTWAMTDWS